MTQSNIVGRIAEICNEFDARVRQVGLAVARAELAKRLAETELPKEWDTVAVCPDCKGEFDTEKKMCFNCGRKTK